MSLKIFAFLAIALFLLSGCIQEEPAESVKQGAIEQCKQICNTAKQQGINLSEGPCLSDSISYPVAGWACDIAHSPRQPADNNPENQCQEYREGKASHFVELNLECELIKAV